MKSIKQILIERDGITAEEAMVLIKEAQEAFIGYLKEGDTYNAECVCEDYLGLESDYLEQLMFA